MTRRSLLSFIFAFVCLGVSSQDRQQAFAITGQANANFNWTDIRGINMATGTSEKIYFENGKSKFSFKDAETGKTVDQFFLKGDQAKSSLINGNVAADKNAINNITPTSLRSAAMAYDKKNQKLFFASMHTGRLIWLDLNSGEKSPSFYTIGKQLVKNDDHNNEAFNITRMTIGADGNGYALSNDGKHLIRFTTGKKTIITNMGSLLDAESNSALSVHNQCTSWGGDIVGDAFGKLYLFTAFQNIFEIDVDTRIATYKGRVNNLPPSFSVNGAAVDDDENVIVSSANTFEGFYKISMNTLNAEKLNTVGQVFNASDLASSNLLNQNMKKPGAAVLSPLQASGNKFITVYPNPVNNGRVKISFESNPAGQYKIALTDLQGRVIENKTVYLKYARQTENFVLKTKPVKGMYFIKVTNAGNQNIYSDKLIVE